jgi:N-methylhydantoinase A
VSNVEALEIEKIREIYSRLQNSASDILKKEAIPEDRRIFTKSVDMRYEGQGHSVEYTLPTHLGQDQLKEEMKRGFSELHYIKYGHVMSSAIQTINYRLRAVGRLDKPPIQKIRSGTTNPPPDAIKEVRKIFMDTSFVQCNVYKRKELLAGNVIKGPAMVEEPSHTTTILDDQSITTDRFGNLVIEVGR